MDYREVKKAATRRAISEATVELLLEHPDRLPTIAQISSRAEISVRTFHNYFADIDEAFFEFVHQALGECPIVCVRGLGLQVVRESVGVCHS
ncbi:TetR/AcrR family transcriptional regulator [Corynebacterium urealyticum]|uniref:TetR/AcrR family transcriptional regulator n=1 Tax=Corynebacterium urealyticum TaxID=43771 RepID=UPI00293E3C70|nr:TetR/AcrR family transcriptional regulator [Corynebacterium urealyticum]WOH94012.1 TetR/AcrR family transcriptional regulator [Corynebacterium urealyticum]